MKPKFKMKTKVKDEVTGFVGHVTACLLYMTGCVQYQVEIAKGTELKAYWIDEGRLIEVKEEKVKKIFKRRIISGGPSRGPSAY